MLSVSIKRDNVSSIVYTACAYGGEHVSLLHLDPPQTNIDHYSCAFIVPVVQLTNSRKILQRFFSLHKSAVMCLRGSRRSKSDLNMDLNGAEISKVVGQIK